MCKTSDPRFIRWQEETIIYQQRFFRQYGDREWDSLPISEIDQINLKISYLLFNKAKENLSSDQQLLVDKCDKRLRELAGSSSELHVGCIYVGFLPKNYENHYFYPVLRTRKAYNHVVFFYEYTSNRVYESWTDYLENNKLPAGWMCYPSTGFYHGSDGLVNLSLCTSPFFDVNVFNVLDSVSFGTGIVSNSLLLASVFFPPISVVEIPAAVALLTYSGYSVSRNISKIIDRINHREGLDSIELWINLATNLGAATTGLVALRFLPVVLRNAALGINIFGAVTMVASLVVKFLQGELASLDLKRLVDLVFVVGNIVINTTQATRLVKVLSEQPRRVANTFNMVANTAFAVVKSVITKINFVDLMVHVLGYSDSFLRYVGMNRIADVIGFLIHNVKNMCDGRLDVVNLMQGFNRHVIVVHEEFFLEIKNAINFFERVFNRPFSLVEICGKMLFQHSWNSVAVEISSEIDAITNNARMTNNADVHDVQRRVINCTQDLASQVQCGSDLEFIAICEILRNNITKEYDQVVALDIINQDGLKMPLPNLRKKQILDSIIDDVKNHQKVAELTAKFMEIRKSIIPNRLINLFSRPLYQSCYMTIYYFQSDTGAHIFDQFVYDSCALLFNDPNLSLTNCQISLHPRQKSLYLKYKDVAIIFDYDMRSNTTLRKTTSHTDIIIIGFIYVCNLANNDVDL